MPSVVDYLTQMQLQEMTRRGSAIDPAGLNASTSYLINKLSQPVNQERIDTAPSFLEKLSGFGKNLYNNFIGQPLQSVSDVGDVVRGNIPAIPITDSTDLRKIGGMYMAQGGTGGVGSIMDAIGSIAAPQAFGDSAGVVTVSALGAKASKQATKSSGVVDRIVTKQLKETMPQSPSMGEAVGASSRLASPFESSLSKSSPYVNEIINTRTPTFEKVPVDVQKNAFGTQTKVFDVVIQPEVLAKRPDNATPITINTWQEAREFNTNPDRIAGWQSVYANSRKIENYAGTGGFRRDPAKAGKLVGVEVGKLTEGCQRSATTVERVRHGLLPAETRLEACYGGDCWTNKTLAAKFGKFENMEGRDLAMATPESIEKWFDGNAGAKRVEQLNNAEFIRMGYSGDDSHAIATGIAQKWLDESSSAGLKKPTIFISAGYAPVTDEAYRALSKSKGKFELHISNSGWFDKNEIMLRFGEFMAAKEAGVPVKMRVITNKDNISGVKMVNEDFLHDLMKQHGVKQHEILETPFHDDALKKNKRSEPSGKFKFICCESGACKSCGVKCMSKVKAGKGLVGASVATTAIYNMENSDGLE